MVEKVKNKTFICHLYLGLWCLYSLQGTLYASGGIISRTLLFFLIFISLAYFFYAIIHYSLPSVLRVLAVLVVIWSIYGGINILFGNGVQWINSFEYLKAIYMSILPIFTMYVFSKKRVFNEESIRAWFFVFLGVSIAAFYRKYNLNLAESSSGQDEFSNNVGYVVLSLFPIIPFFRKRSLLQYSILFGCSYLVLSSFKRGAIIIVAITLVWFLFMSLMETGKRRNRIVVLLLSVIVIVGAVYAVQYLLESSDYFKLRVDSTLSGDSSGRDYLYTTYSDYLFSETNVIRLLFGYGADATLRLFNQYAHNDWLEIAINNGLIVAFLYLAFWFYLFKTLQKNRSNKIMHQVLGLFFIIYFMRSFFSMSYNAITVYSASALGYVLALQQSQNSSITDNNR